MRVPKRPSILVSGVYCGMVLNLAGWRIRLDIHPPELVAAIAPRYAPFCVPGEDGDADMIIEITAEETTRSGGSLLNAELTTSGVNFLLDGPQFCGMISPLEGRASLRVTSDAVAREIEYFLRIVVSLFAYHAGGLLIHCAGLKAGAGVHLFAGQSGSGKSTIVSLSAASRRATALGDDLVLLRRKARDWWAYGTPFWNLETVDRDGQLDSGPVLAIYKLVQDRGVFVAPMSAGAATAELAANCPIANSQPALLTGLLDRCRDIAGAVRVERLHFRKDDSFWDVISVPTNRRDR